MSWSTKRWHGKKKARNVRNNQGYSKGRFCRNRENSKRKSLVKKARKRRKFWVELILTLVVIGLYLITYQLVGKLLK